MYIHREIEDMIGKFWPMSGVLNAKAYRTNSLGRFGYITLTGEKDSAVIQKGDTVCGHEFHYFDSTNPGSDYIACKPSGKRNWECIMGTSRSAAGYPHLYYWSNPSFAAGFVRSAAEYTAKII